MIKIEEKHTEAKDSIIINNDLIWPDQFLDILNTHDNTKILVDETVTYSLILTYTRSLNEETTIAPLRAAPNSSKKAVTLQPTSDHMYVSQMLIN